MQAEGKSVFWRISVIGTPGSGKTTLARQIAQALQIPHIELDALFWGPNWTESKTEEFRDRIVSAIAAPTWVADGNYRRSGGDLVRDKANLIVWLDYSRQVVMQRIIWRTLNRVISHQELWSGNRESWRQAFFSQDSMIYYTWRKHSHYREEYRHQFSLPEFQGRMVRLRSPQEAQDWLTGLRPNTIS
ncbi:MAG TPA: AAA family ATPase [Trichocoleus sp.]